MTTPNITTELDATIDTAAVDTQGIVGTLWLLGAAFVGLLLMYVIGTDQGMVSVFGADSHVHEFIHDARHALGFPCH
jgi:hypothetical protein